MVNNKFVAKWLKKEWFSNNGFINEYNQIIAKTAFPLSSDKFSERLWHICNDSTSSIKCHNSQCNNIPAFTGFFTGYLKYCCNRCAQTDDVVINKIKVTNLEKYGNEYGLQSTIIKDFTDFHFPNKNYQPNWKISMNPYLNGKIWRIMGMIEYGIVVV